MFNRGISAMPTLDDAIGRRVEALDLTLFEEVHSQSSEGDRRAWLAVQRSVRLPAGYTYLEIGSHLGGSIQQHLVDPLCRKIVSIDRRPPSQPDDSKKIDRYADNSTARMLDNLGRVAPGELGKVLCFDADARDISLDQVPKPVDFCFIDGEHTHQAVLSDFDFCLGVSSPDAAICFHDAQYLHRALRAILAMLRARGIPFTARKLGGVTFGIFLGECAALNDDYIKADSFDGDYWIRLRRLRDMIPGWLRPIAGWAARRCTRATARGVV
jgi:hypothetical protein